MHMCHNQITMCAWICNSHQIKQIPTNIIYRTYTKKFSRPLSLAMVHVDVAPPATIVPCMQMYHTLNKLTRQNITIMCNNVT
jgi:hypothetical protein